MSSSCVSRTCVAAGTSRSCQPHMRGGRHEPLDDAEIVAKFHANAAHGGWPRERAEQLLSFCQNLAGAPDLAGLRQFRC